MEVFWLTKKYRCVSPRCDFTFVHYWVSMCGSVVVLATTHTHTQNWTNSIWLGKFGKWAVAHTLRFIIISYFSTSSIGYKCSMDSTEFIKRSILPHLFSFPSGLRYQLQLRRHDFSQNSPIKLLQSQFQLFDNSGWWRRRNYKVEKGRATIQLSSSVYAGWIAGSFTD